MTAESASVKSFRFARNVGWSLLGQTGAWLIGFFVTPYLVRRMGMESYGLYLILMIVPSYLLMLTFSAGMTTLIKTSELAGGRNVVGLRQLLRLSFHAHGTCVLVGAIVLILIAPWASSRFFNVPEALEPLAVWVLRCAALGAFLVSLSQLGTSVLQGLQRFDIHSVVTLAQSVLIPLGVAAVLAGGGDLFRAAAVTVLIHGLIAAGSLKASWSQLRHRGLLEGGSGETLPLGPLARASISLWLIQWAWIIANQFDRLFIGNALSLKELTLYAVPAGLLMRLQTIPSTIATVVVPMISELAGPETEGGLARMYLKSVRAILWSALPPLLLLFSVMPQFLTLWLGPEFGLRGVWPARLLVVAHAAALLAHMPRSAACGRDMAHLVSAASWAQAAISIGAWFLLVPRLGILGVALGFLLGQALTIFFLLQSVHRRLLGLGFGRFFRESLAAPLASAALLLLIVFPLHHLAGSWTRLIALSAAGFSLFYGSAWFFMDEQDKALLKRFLAGVL